MTHIREVLIFAFALLIGACAHSPKLETKREFVFFVFNEPLPGRESEYLRFYNEEHMVDVAAIPGFVDGRRYVLNDLQLAPKPTTPPLPRFLTLYTIQTDDLPSVQAEIRRRIGSGEITQSKTYDRSKGVSIVYEAINRKRSSRLPIDDAVGPEGQLPSDLVHFVQTAAIRGREAEYERWYTDHHLEDMITTRGFRTSQRLKLVDPGRSTPHPPENAAIFTIHTGDDAAVIDAFKAGADRRTPTNTADRAATRGYTYRAITPVLLHEEAVRKHAAAMQR